MVVSQRPGQITAVVCAAFDDAADAAIRDRIAALRAAGLRVQSPPRHRPHLTLAAVSVAERELVAVHRLVEELAARHERFAIRLGHLGVFPQGGVLWLAPDPSASLLALHADADDTLAAAGHDRAFGARSAPPRWIAHCTLATRLDNAALGQAVSLMSSRFRPVVGEVTSLMTILLGRRGEERLFAL